VEQCEPVSGLRLQTAQASLTVAEPPLAWIEGARMKTKPKMSGAEVFIRFREYVRYMGIVHPGKPRLNYRNWLDYGWRE
jgi:hypothetical protein